MSIARTRQTIARIQQMDAADIAEIVMELEDVKAALLEALQNLDLAVLHNGDWDDGCFYHNGTSASELERPLDAARAAIAKALGA